MFIRSEDVANKITAGKGILGGRSFSSDIKPRKEKGFSP